MLKRLFEIILGILFLPVCIAGSIALYESLNSVNAISYYLHKYFFLGIATYPIVHILLFKPNYLYVFGHEFTHAIAVMLCMGKVKSVKVSSSGGNVSADKSNFFVALAPYFFPFYTVLAAAVFFIVTVGFKIDIPQNIFLFILGFTLSFHIILTIEFLKTRQSDFLHIGYLPSVCLIYVINLAIITVIFGLLFDKNIIPEFFRISALKSKEIYILVFRQLF